MNDHINFRLAQHTDKSFLLKLRNETMNEHIVNAGLTPDVTAHMDRINYRFDCAYIVGYNNVDIGLLKVIKEGDVWDLVQIQLIPSAQGKGLGRRIIVDILAQASQNNVGVKLSVFKHNPAKKLYRDLGFSAYLETESTYEMCFNLSSDGMDID